LFSPHDQLSDREDTVIEISLVVSLTILILESQDTCRTNSE
jgi:hypothetical protein